MLRPDVGRIAGVLAVSLLLVLAGCSGGGETTPTPTDATDGGEMDTDDAGTETTDGSAPDTATETDSASGSASDSGSASEFIRPYDWTRGESYTYQMSGAADATYTWTVQSATSSQVRAEIDGLGGTSTLTGPQGNVFSGDADDPSAATFILLRFPTVISASETLEVGNSWRFDDTTVRMTEGSWTYVTVDVTGTTTIAGNECYEITITPDGDGAQINACVSEGWPFALSMELTAQGQTSSYTLQRATRP